MGRGYVVEAVVEKYFSSLEAGSAAFTTGLLIGQSSPQRDYVVLPTKTPQRGTESSSGALDDVDIEWVTEHAKQVSRMLPGGLSVLGVFMIVLPELSKEAMNTLRKLVFAVDKYLTKGTLWDGTDEDVTERVALQICSKTRKVVCKTFDVKDPKSSAKPADWKYQSGVSSSWPVVTCSVRLDLRLPVLDRSSEEKHKSIKEGLQRWAKRIIASTCLINGKVMAPEAELVAGQKRNPKLGQQKFQAQVLLPPMETQLESSVCVAAQPSPSVVIRGQVSCRAYVHSNKPKAGQAMEAIKRDIVNTVSCRVDMLFDDLYMDQAEDRGAAEGQQCLPLRVFAPVPEAGFCVCDYMFPDESVAEVAEHLQEMLDCSVTEESICSGLEVSHVEPSTPAPAPAPTHGTGIHQEDTPPHLQTEAPKDVPKKQKNFGYFVGVVVAGGVAVLAAVTSLLYLGE
ncbi:protein odr-4 homolog [Alosa alosa]|uniref:protein odr-4 homolog n=1 Tax=Alosa alosa TaxID=278164 RepID=UPI0020154F9B|nr:protein odr-4 homolog [Alosa alosa]